MKSQGFTVEDRGSDLYATGKQTIICRFHDSMSHEYMQAVSQALATGIIRPGVVILPEPDGTYTFHIHFPTGMAKDAHAALMQVLTKMRSRIGRR